MCKSSHSAQQGSSLIEVLIALFILAIGLLGVLAMQASAIQGSRNALYYSQAHMLSDQILEAMRAGPITALPNYVIAFGGTAPAGADCEANPCTDAQLAQWNLLQWENDVANILPLGDVQIQPSVAVNPNNLFTVSIQFQSGIDEDNGAAILQTIQFASGF